MSDPSRFLEPLRLAFDVGSTPADAFDVWTNRISTWWPTAHTITGDSGSEIVIEPRVGGRIFERAPGGEEHDWGSVTVWEPPAQFGYRWHITSPPAEATLVEVRFTARPDGTTLVEIEHGGFDALGERGSARRADNLVGWRELIPLFIDACAGASESEQTENRAETGAH